MINKDMFEFNEKKLRTTRNHFEYEFDSSIDTHKENFKTFLTHIKREISGRNNINDQKKSLENQTVSKLINRRGTLLNSFLF